MTPTFERPHWSCSETAHGRFELIAEVGVKHPPALAVFWITEEVRGEPVAVRGYLIGAVNMAERLIAASIALRARGEPCLCGVCE